MRIGLFFLFASTIASGWGSASTARTSPHELILEISYGAAPGQLDTTSVDSDDPDRTLVESIRIDEAGVWILPRLERGQTALLHYTDGEFVETVPFRGYPRDFLLMPEGIYSWARSARVGTSAHFAFDAGPGTDPKYAELPESVGIHRGILGRLEGTSSGPILVFLDVPQQSFFSLSLGWGLPRPELSINDVSRGAQSEAGPISQDWSQIMRGGEPILDLGSEGGSLFHVLPHGGFVVRRSGGGLPTFEVYDSQAELIREIVTFRRTESFSVASSPWVFTTTGAYQLLLGPTNARVVRF